MRNLRVITIGVVLGMLLSTQAYAEKTLRVATWLPPTHLMNAVVLTTWGEWVEKATDGHVKIKLEYGLGHPKSLIDLVQDGAVDAAWTYHGYLPGRFKLTQLPELPLHGIGPEAASVAHWRINEKYLSKAGEHDGVIVAGLFTHGPGQIHMREPIESLADMKGKKIRVGGGIQGEIGKRMGIEGVPAPGSKVYEILSQGVADGVFMPMEVKKSLRIKEVAPYTYKFPQGMYLGSFGLFLNEDFMAGLSDHDREAIMSVSGEKLSRMAGAAWGKADQIGEDDARASGNTIVQANDAMLADFAKLAEGMDADWIERVKDRNIDARAALKEFREIAQAVQSGG
ncbi:MAG: TRAP transporter substrate-binding protein [Gammaproteobacteria bacterium]|nr:TRAP transporter substrate-binding protein [Gammaproteobacteria bacterium]